MYLTIGCRYCTARLSYAFCAPILKKALFVNRKFAKATIRVSIVGAMALFAVACSSTPDVVSLDNTAPIIPAAPVYVLSDISGASPQVLENLLGAPSLTRREGNGEYRRYDLSTCALIIILYPDEGGVVRAAHIDTAAVNAGGDKPDLNACLAAG